MWSIERTSGRIIRCVNQKLINNNCTSYDSKYCILQSTHHRMFTPTKKLKIMAEEINKQIDIDIMHNLQRHQVRTLEHLKQESQTYQCNRQSSQAFQCQRCPSFS